ncbi:MAG: hypothetical protein K6G18_01120 [Treponema sp.]|nr:hypothetical protein [Treponema sp.]
MSYKRRHLTRTGRDAARLEYDADGNLIKECSCGKEAVYAYNAANRMAESHITEIRNGSRQTPKDTVYASDRFVTTALTSGAGDKIFKDCSTRLVGGAGTSWNASNPTDTTYAHIDGVGGPGYFTAAP